MKVRPVADADIDAVVALWTACGLTRPWNDPHRDIAFARGKPNSEVLVGECDGRIVASVMVGHDGHRGALYYVSVDPAERKQGLGTAIVKAAEGWLKDRRVWKTNLLVRSGNAGVQGFYEALGYEAAEVFSMGKWLSSEDRSQDP